MINVRLVQDDDSPGSVNGHGISAAEQRRFCEHAVFVFGKEIFTKNKWVTYFPPRLVFFGKISRMVLFFAEKLQPHGVIFKNKIANGTATKRVFPSLRVCMKQRNFAVSCFYHCWGIKGPVWRKTVSFV